ncbi:MAG: oxygen-independent coproporphyrinogen III oxidase [Saliniramus fredricksonii]|uniref:Coproporphyrinogen-III oxidase n=1 Tax=Saliniramus fredricksonii TaxID=1653334 RepID=A0A0P7Y5K5_9HYPH|nr:oxygen-independent coproporphyrinogen III oxidase [Saliniramus fredricksonii]KPQ12481.1 MAG: oxygen-independent coproporphyrinogen III oxidase [Saliniramus fredricksonii]SCC81382.1 coproporphyrinogen III oxidase, anaerobic [Saliniramus fredricksonii]
MNTLPRTTIPMAYALETVPRYTSYPTAAQFDARIDEGVCRDWLGALDPAAPLSFYVHVPYCRALCWYCGCHTSVLNDDARIARYARRLMREADLLAEATPQAGPVAHLHFGGGTPTILAPEDFAAVIDRIRERFPFAPDAEIAVEIDPRTLEPEMAQALARAGVNRVSLGIQDMDPQVQKLVNRVQPLEDVVRTMDLLRSVGITRVNADFIYGLPKQSVAHVRRSIRTMLDLGIDRAAVFGYAHVPWFKKHQNAIDADLLPGAGERLEQARAAEAAFAEAGWQAIGFDHYAHPGDAMAQAARAGTLRRNFQGYTTDAADTLIGIGASSIGALPQGYVQNEPHLGKWAQAIDAGHLPVVRGVSVTADDRLRRDAIMQLMAGLEVDLAEMARAYGQELAIFDAALMALEPLVADGLCRIEGYRIRVTPQARFFVRNVAARLDAYWQPSPGRHSLAV